MRDEGGCIALADSMKCEVRSDQTQGRITLCTPCSVLRTPRPSPLILHPSSFILLAVLSLVLVASRPAAGSKAPGPPIHGDWSEPLRPQRPTTEAGRDRVEALALLVAASSAPAEGGICRGPAMLPAIVAARSAVVDDRPGDHSAGGPAASLRRSRPLRAEGRGRGRRRSQSAPPAWRLSDASRGIGPMPWPSTKRRWPRGAKPRKPPPTSSGGWSWAGST